MGSNGIPERQTVRFTPTERRILALLADGEAHSLADLLPALEDECAEPSTLNVHIARMRPRLNYFSQDVLCRERGGTTYRLVRFLSSDCDGAT